jgi:hypothetical protein
MSRIKKLDYLRRLHGKIIKQNDGYMFAVPIQFNAYRKSWVWYYADVGGLYLLGNEKIYTSQIIDFKADKTTLDEYFRVHPSSSFYKRAVNFILKKKPGLMLLITTAK